MNGRFLVLINPYAGAGRGARRAQEIVRHLMRARLPADFEWTEYPEHATELVRRSLKSGAQGVAVVGGDGTANEAINGFFDAASGQPIGGRPWFSVLPSGTGSDFARSLSIPREVSAMVARFVQDKRRPIDVGWLNCTSGSHSSRRRFFLNVANVGLAASIVAGHRGRWMGPASYLVSTLKTLAGYRRPKVTITVDGKRTQPVSILNVAIANGSYFGGGMKIAPGAELADGSLDLVRLNMPAAGAFRLAAAIYQGRHLDDPEVTLDRVSRVRIESSEAVAVPVEADGESLGTLPAEFEVRPRAIEVRG